MSYSPPEFPLITTPQPETAQGNNPVAETHQMVGELEMSLARAATQNSVVGPDGLPPLTSYNLRTHGLTNPDDTRRLMSPDEESKVSFAMFTKGYIETTPDGQGYRLTPKWFQERYPHLREEVLKEDVDSTKPVWGVTSVPLPDLSKRERPPRTFVKPGRRQEDLDREEALRKQAAIDQTYAEQPPKDRAYRLLTTIREINPFVTTDSPDLPSHIDEPTALGLFTYADALGKQTIGETHSPNAHKYAQKLVELYEAHGGKKLGRLAATMTKAAEESLRLAGINEPSEYCKSPTWALWDIAKQAYLAEHPEESSGEYATRELDGQRFDNLIDPTSSGESIAELDGEEVDLAELKRQEIIDRHVGWEVVRSWYTSSPRHIGNIPLADPHLEEVLDIIAHGQTNADFLDSDKIVPALRSFELARIGAIVNDFASNQPMDTSRHVPFWDLQRLIERWPQR